MPYEILPDSPAPQASAYEILPSAAPSGEKQTRFDRLVQGMRDPIDGGAQLLYNSLPKGLVQAVDSANNWVADKTGLVARVPEGGINQSIQEREAAYQQARREAMAATLQSQITGKKEDPGFDGWRMTGNVVSPVNLAIGARAPAAVSLLGRVAAGAGVGAASSALAPVTSGDYFDEKKQQIGSGALVGGGIPVVGSALGSVISPQVRQSVKTLLDEKITPTMGQILGGGWQRAEDKATSIPLIGDLISSARSKGLDEFNRAAMARALGPVNGEVPKEIGRDAVASVRTQLGQKYDDLLPRLTFRADGQFSQEMNQIQQMAQNLAPKEAAKYIAVMQQHLSKMSPSGSMTGETFKKVESGLGQDAKQFLSSPDPYQKELGQALQATLESFRSGLARSVADPADAAALKAINTGYANYARIKGAAASIGAADGKFTPAQLANAIRRGDATAGKRAYSEGTALMQDLTDAGKDVLSSKYPDSGTAGRLFLGSGAAGGLGAAAWVNPKTVIPAALASIPYAPGGRQLMAALLTQRPDLAKPVAEAVKKGSLIAAPGVAGSGIGPALVGGNGN